MQALLNLVGRSFRSGTLEFVAPGSRRWTLGHGDPHARIRARDAGVLRRILLNPRLALGETYMDGGWEPEGGRLLPVLEVCARNLAALEQSSFSAKVRHWLAKAGEINTPGRSRANASRHYDLDHELYRRFLDADLHYSCAYFREAGMDLEAAQQAKCAHIAAKLDLRSGAQVLDVGCGWGSLAMHLAQHHDVHVLGITLSTEQLQIARQRARERGLADKVQFRYQDYRETRGRFDAVVSVGMFEHVGRPQYEIFFRRVHELLAHDGVALIHSIGRTTPPGDSNPWIRKYIFPGGYVPAASEALAAIERSGLVMTDLEVWRLHYARTLAAWHERFQQARSEIRSSMGERFCRMWEFYLQGAEAGFRWGDLVVFQLQMTPELRRLPGTRDYVYGQRMRQAHRPAQPAAQRRRS